MSESGALPERPRAGDENLPPWRSHLRKALERAWFQRLIIGLIAVNAVVLGLETSAEVTARFGPLLSFLDRLILGVFVIEILARILAYGGRFFRDPWSLFDFVVVAIALIPTSGPLAILRTLRVLRVFRLISAVPRMRRVVEALLEALPGMGAIVALFCLLFYVGGVIATKLFGAAFTEWFGTLGRSLYTLFQIMTLESWSMGIVRPVLAEYPYAWAFFVPFIVITTFSVLNLFVAVIVSAMQSRHNDELDEDNRAAHAEREQLLEEVRGVRAELAAMRLQFETARPPAKP